MYYEITLPNHKRVFQWLGSYVNSWRLIGEDLKNIRIRTDSAKDYQHMREHFHV